MPKLHPSDIRIHERCPYSFRLQKVDRIRLESSGKEVPFGFRFGRAAHDCFEAIYRHLVRIEYTGPLHAPKIIQAAMTAADFAQSTHHMDEADMDELKAQIIDYLMERHTFSYEQVLGIEEWMSKKLGSGVEVNCRYDRAERQITRHGVTCMTIDLKGRASKDFQHLDQDPQALITLICARENWPTFPYYGFQHHYTAGRDKRTIIRSATEVDHLAVWMSANYRDQHDAMWEGPWPARKGPWCDWCSVKTICEAVGGTPKHGQTPPDWIEDET